MQGTDIAAIRDRLDLTQAELAERVGLSRVFISNMENGKKPVDPRTALALRCLAIEADLGNLGALLREVSALGDAAVLAIWQSAPDPEHMTLRERVALAVTEQRKLAF